MDATATEAKNRLGQMLEICQREPVVIAKSGRRHSVLISAAHYDALLAASQARLTPPADAAAAFYAQHKEWVDAQNRHVAEHGIFGEEYRRW